MSASLEFRALGPLVVLADGRSVEVGKGTERALIALLVLHADQSLSSDAIIDALWGERPPPTAREMVRNYVARARKRLGENAIATLPTGYQLRADADAIDWMRFERLAVEGSRALEAGEPQAALGSLEQALALWRGRPLPELDFAATREPEVARLEELRLRAIEDRVEAELSLGRSGVLVPELEQLVREHPYRERLLGQLMLALYRCGRQKDALDRYQAGRRLLVEEAGLEPSPELQQLNLAILRQDPELSARALDGSAELSSLQGRRWSRRALAVAAVVGAVVVAAAIAVPLAFVGNPAPVRLPPHSLAALDPRSGAPVGSVELGRGPGAIAVGPGAVWVGTATPPAAVAVDPRSLRVGRTVPLGAIPYSAAAADGSLWLGNAFDGTLTRIDDRGRAGDPFRPEPRASGRLPMAYGLGSLWVGSQDDAVSRIDPGSGRTVAVVRGVEGPEAVTAGVGSVWVAEATRDGVLRIDPQTNRVAREIPIGGRGRGVAIGHGAVWVVTPETGSVWRIDARTAAVTASIDVGGRPTRIAATDDAVWVATRGGILTEIDPRTNLVVRTVALNREVASLASGGGRLWVTLG